MFLSFTIATIVLLLGWYFSKFSRQVILAWKLKGPFAYPLFGNANLIKPDKMLRELKRSPRRKYGPIVRLWATIIPVFLLIDPYHVHTVLSSKANNSKASLYHIFKKAWGPRSLVIIGDPEMSRKRKMQQRLFTSAAYQNYLEIIWTVAIAFVPDLEKNINGDQNIVRRANQCLRNFTDCLILGIPAEEWFYERPKLIIKNTDLVDRLSRPWLLLKGIYQFTKSHENEDSVYQQTMSVIRSRVLRIRQEMESGSESLSLLRMLMEISDEHPDEYSLEDVMDDTLTYLAAGSDATASAIAFLFHELAKNPEHQETCYQEQMQIVGASNQAPNSSNLRDMVFLEQCVNEAIRIHPPVPIIGRQCTEDIQIGSVSIPAGSTVMIPIYALHHDEDSFPNPGEYNPDRFLPENIEKRAKGSFMGFSTGPRTCPGNKLAMMAIKSLASAVIRNYTLHLVDGKEKVYPVFRITLQAHKGIWVKFTKRSKAFTT